MDEMSRRRLLQGMLALPLVTLLPISTQLLADDVANTNNPEKTHTVTLHGNQGPQRLNAELAISDEQRRHGLMDRKSLGEDAGMLFVYSRLVTGGFWMYRTHIPLDIAFIGDDGRISEIRHMQPCVSSSAQACPITQPKVSYRAALEVNAGYFAARGIRVGDCVSWPGDKGGQCQPETQS
ncbi:DUF192 domain-containing protein [Halomonas halocynthiae]|uniref:DUF192 domain-containing protein n=1 Tax=Halomonas halocynthiae TaxID=176290 RepID=UPI000487A7CC|nr:DUF192 domain-containing protein [Halomonas halocynthiae]